MHREGFQGKPRDGQTQWMDEWTKSWVRMWMNKWSLNNWLKELGLLTHLYYSVSGQHFTITEAGVEESDFSFYISTQSDLIIKEAYNCFYSKERTAADTENIQKSDKDHSQVEGNGALLHLSYSTNW